MSDPICVATFNRHGDLTLRWYSSVEHFGRRRQIATASEHLFSTHPYVGEVPPWVAGAAARAQHLLAIGDVEQARQMATHRVVRFLFCRRLELIPVKHPFFDRCQHGVQFLSECERCPGGWQPIGDGRG